MADLIGGSGDPINNKNNPLSLFDNNIEIGKGYAVEPEEYSLKQLSNIESPGTLFQETGNIFNNPNLDKHLSIYDIDNPDLSRGDIQTRGEQFTHGLARSIPSIATKFLTGLGTVLNVPNAIMEGDASRMWDNEMVKTTSKWEEKLKEALPIYHSRESQSGGFVDKVTSAEFWADEFLDGAAFMASAFIPGGALGKAGKVAGLAGKTLNTGGKIGRALGVSDKIIKADKALQLAGSTIYNTISESAVEAKDTEDSIFRAKSNQMAFDTYGTSYDNLTPEQKVQIESEAKAIARKQAKNVLWSNGALLLATNAVGARFMHGTPYDDHLKAYNKMARGGQDIQKVWKKTRNGILTGAATEGVIEEGFQNAFQGYNMDVAMGKEPGNKFEDYVGGYLGKWVEGFTETDGQTAMFLGAILGAPMAGFTSYAEAREHNKEQEDLSTFYEAAKADAVKINEDLDATMTAIKAVENDNSLDGKVKAEKLNELKNKLFQGELYSLAYDGRLDGLISTEQEKELINKYKKIQELDNETSLYDKETVPKLEEISKEVNTLKQQKEEVQDEQQKVKIDNKINELLQRSASIKEQGLNNKNVSEAMREGYTTSMNDNTFKEDAKKSIEFINEAKEEYKKIHRKFPSKEAFDLGIPRKIYKEKIRQLIADRNITERQEAEVEELSNIEKQINEFQSPEEKEIYQKEFEGIEEALEYQANKELSNASEEYIAREVLGLGKEEKLLTRSEVKDLQTKIKEEQTKEKEDKNQALIDEYQQQLDKDNYFKTSAKKIKEYSKKQLKGLDTEALKENPILKKNSLLGKEQIYQNLKRNRKLATTAKMEKAEAIENYNKMNSLDWVKKETEETKKLLKLVQNQKKKQSWINEKIKQQKAKLKNLRKTEDTEKVEDGINTDVETNKWDNVIDEEVNKEEITKTPTYKDLQTQEAEARREQLKSQDYSNDPTTLVREYLTVKDQLKTIRNNTNLYNNKGELYNESRQQLGEQLQVIQKNKQEIENKAEELGINLQDPRLTLAAKKGITPNEKIFKSTGTTTPFDLSDKERVLNKIRKDLYTDAKSLITDLSDLDYVEGIINNDIEKFSEMSNELEGKFNNISKKIPRKLKKKISKKDLADRKKQIEEISSDIKEYEKLIKRRYEELEEIEVERELIRERIDFLTEASWELQDNLDNYKNSDKVKSQISKFKQRVNKINEEINKSEERISLIKRLIDSILNALGNIKNSITAQVKRIPYAKVKAWDKKEEQEDKKWFDDLSNQIEYGSSEVQKLNDNIKSLQKEQKNIIKQSNISKEILDRFSKLYVEKVKEEENKKPIKLKQQSTPSITEEENKDGTDLFTGTTEEKPDETGERDTIVKVDDSNVITIKFNGEMFHKNGNAVTNEKVKNKALGLKHIQEGTGQQVEGKYSIFLDEEGKVKVINTKNGKDLQTTSSVARRMIAQVDLESLKENQQSTQEIKLKQSTKKGFDEEGNWVKGEKDKSDNNGVIEADKVKVSNIKKKVVLKNKKEVKREVDDAYIDSLKNTPEFAGGENQPTNKLIPSAKPPSSFVREEPNPTDILFLFEKTEDNNEKQNGFNALTLQDKNFEHEVVEVETEEGTLRTIINKTDNRGRGIISNNVNNTEFTLANPNHYNTGDTVHVVVDLEYAKKQDIEFQKALENYNLAETAEKKQQYLDELIGLIPLGILTEEQYKGFPDMRVIPTKKPTVPRGERAKITHKEFGYSEVMALREKFISKKAKNLEPLNTIEDLFNTDLLDGGFTTKVKYNNGGEFNISYKVVDGGAIPNELSIKIWEDALKSDQAGLSVIAKKGTTKVLHGIEVDNPSKRKEKPGSVLLTFQNSKAIDGIIQTNSIPLHTRPLQGQLLKNTSKTLENIILKYVQDQFELDGETLQGSQIEDFRKQILNNYVYFAHGSPEGNKQIHHFAVDDFAVRDLLPRLNKVNNEETKAYLETVTKAISLNIFAPEGSNRGAYSTFYLMSDKEGNIRIFTPKSGTKLMNLLEHTNELTQEDFSTRFEDAMSRIYFNVNTDRIAEGNLFKPVPDYDTEGNPIGVVESYIEFLSQYQDGIYTDIEPLQLEDGTITGTSHPITKLAVGETVTKSKKDVEFSTEKEETKEVETTKRPTPKIRKGRTPNRRTSKFEYSDIDNTSLSDYSLNSFNSTIRSTDSITYTVFDLIEQVRNLKEKLVNNTKLTEDEQFLQEDLEAIESPLLNNPKNIYIHLDSIYDAVKEFYLADEIYSIYDNFEKNPETGFIGFRELSKIKLNNLKFKVDAFLDQSEDGIINKRFDNDSRDDREKSASARIRRFLYFLPKLEKVTDNKNNISWEQVYDKDGNPEFYDYIETYNSLIRAVGSYPINQIVDKIRELADSNESPRFQAIKQKIEQQLIEDESLVKELVSVISSQVSIYMGNQIKTRFIGERGNKKQVIESTVFSSNAKTVGQELVDSWHFAFKQTGLDKDWIKNDPNEGLIYDLTALEKFYNELLSKDNNKKLMEKGSFEYLERFFKELGIDIDLATIKEFDRLQKENTKKYQNVHAADLSNFIRSLIDKKVEKGIKTLPYITNNPFLGGSISYSNALMAQAAYNMNGSLFTANFRDNNNNSRYSFNKPTKLYSEVMKLIRDPEYRDQLRNQVFVKNNFILKALAGEFPKSKVDYMESNLDIAFWDSSKKGKSKIAKEYYEQNEIEKLITQLDAYYNNGSNKSFFFFPTPADKTTFPLLGISTFNSLPSINQEGKIRTDAHKSGSLAPLFDIIGDEVDRINTYIAKRRYKESLQDKIKETKNVEEKTKLENELKEIENKELANTDSGIAEYFLTFPKLNELVERVVEDFKDETTGKKYYKGQIIFNHVMDYANGVTYDELAKDDNYVAVKDYLISYLEDAVKAKMDKLDKFGVDLTKELNTDLLNNTDLPSFLLKFVYNDFLVKTSAYQLFIGDPAQLPKIKMTPKQTTEHKFSFAKNENTVLTEAEKAEKQAFIETLYKNIISTYENIFKRNAKEIAPKVQYYWDNPFYKVVFTSDTKVLGEISKDLLGSNEAVNVNSPLGKILRNIYPTDEALKERLTDIKNNFTDIESSDAQELTTLKEHLENLVAQGRLKKSERDRLMDIYDRDGIFNPEDLNIILQPLKPLQVGQLFEQHKIGEGENDYVSIPYHYYIKSSSFPLIKQLTQHSDNLEKLRLIMEGKNPDGTKSETNEGFDRLVFKSATKEGFRANANLMDQFGKMIEVNQFDSRNIQTLNRENFGIQLDVPYEADKQKTVDASQIRKLIFGNYPASRWVNYKGQSTSMSTLKDTHDRTHVIMYHKRFNKLLDTLGIIAQNEDGSYVIEDISYIKDLILQEATRQNYSLNDLLALRNIELPNGNKIFDIPLFFQNNADKIESLLNSIIKNKVLKFKQHGKSYVQVSSAGAVFNKTQVSDQVPEGVVFTKDFKGKNAGLGYRVYDNELFAEVVMPSFIIDPKTKKPVNMQEYVKDGYLDTEKIDPELLKLVGFRIPTQGPASYIRLKVVGFLPKGYGDALIVPSEIVAQMGSDFDVDKLYTYFYKSKKDKDGNYKKLESFENYEDYSEEGKEELFYEWVKEDPIYKEMAKEYSETINTWKNANTPLKKQLQDNKDFRDKLYKANEYLLSTWMDLDPNTLATLENDPLIQYVIKQAYGKVEEDLSKDELKELVDEYIDTTLEEIKLIRGEFKEFPKNLEFTRFKEQRKEEFNNLVSDQELITLLSEDRLMNINQDIYHTILADPYSIDKSLDKLDSVKLREVKDDIVAKDLETSKNEFIHPVNSGLMGDDYNQSIVEINASSKMGVGVMSLESTWHTIFQHNDIYLTNYQDKYGNKKPTMPVIFNDPKGNLYADKDINYIEVIEQGQSLKIKFNPDNTVTGSIQDLIGILPKHGAFLLNKINGFLGQNISKTLEAIQNAALDGAKDPILGPLNLNEHTFGVASLIARAGFDEAFIGYFMRQPAIKEYIVGLINLHRYSQVEYNPNAKDELVNSIFQKYGTTRLKMYKKYRKLKEDAMTSSTSFNTVSYSLNELQNQFNGNVIDEVQANLLQQFIEYDEIARSIQGIQSVGNVDTKYLDVNLYTSYLKQLKREKVNNQVNIANRDSLLSSNTMQGAAIEYGVNGSLNIFGNRNIFPINSPALQKAYNQIAFLSNKFNDVLNKADAKDVERALKATALSEVYNEVFGKEDITKKRNELLYGKNSLAKRILRFRKKLNKEDIPLIFDLMELDTSGSGTDYIKINTAKDIKDQLTFELNVSWHEAINSEDVAVRTLAEDLVKFVLLTGDKPSAIHVGKFMPSEYKYTISDAYRNVMNKLNNDVLNLNLVEYYQNNLNDAYTISQENGEISNKNLVITLSGDTALNDLLEDTKNDEDKEEYDLNRYMLPVQLPKDQTKYFLPKIVSFKPEKGKMRLFVYKQSHKGSFIYEPVPTFDDKFYQFYTTNVKQPSNINNTNVTPTEGGTKVNNLLEYNYTSVKNVLEAITEKSEESDNAALADLLNKLLTVNSKVIDTKLQHKDTNNPKDVATYHDGTITVNVGNGIFNRNPEEVLLHEIVHAFTADIVDDYYANPKENKQYAKSIKTLEKIVNTLENKHTDTLIGKELIALGNEPMSRKVGELIAHFMEKPTVVEEMNNIPFNSSYSLLDKIKEVIKDLFEQLKTALGVDIQDNTMAAEALDSILNVMNVNDLNNNTQQQTKTVESDIKISNLKKKFKGKSKYSNINDMYDSLDNEHNKC